MPVNPVLPESRRQVASRIVAQHAEVLIAAIGFLLGAIVAIVAGVLT